MPQSPSEALTSSPPPPLAARAGALMRRAAPHAADRWAAALIALGATIRLGLILLGWPRTDSDEGTMGLMALHIVTRGEHPLFFYGQSYMGTAQAYLGALMFHLFGVSLVSLRLGLLLLFILYLAVMYPLLRLLFGPMFALVGLLLLDLGGPDLFRPQLLALGGYPETLLLAALCILLALKLALDESGERPSWRRPLLYGALGLAAGLGWWSDQLIFPFLLATGALLVIFRRRDLRWQGALALLAGVVIGLAPQILFIVTHPAAKGPSAFDALEWEGPSTIVRFFTQFGAHLLGLALVAFPNITGLGWVCAAPTLPSHALAAPQTSGALLCLGLRGVWSVALLALGAVAGMATWQALGGYSGLRRLADATGEERTAATRLCGRLALLMAGLLTMLFYLVSLAAATPASNARYLIGVNLALPALLYPLWAGASFSAAAGEMSGRMLSRVHAALSTFSSPRGARARWALMGVLALTLAGGVAATYHASAATHAGALADEKLMRDLERLGIHHMRTDYWTCDKLIFLSQERIICDSLKPDLTVEAYNRYPPYVTEVEADPRAAYVFSARGPQAAALAQRARDPAWPYTLTRLDGYVVYLRK